MARRRKDIERRKKLAGGPGREQEAPDIVKASPEKFEPEDRFSEEVIPPRPRERSERLPEPEARAPARAATLVKDKETLLLALLLAYVLVLGLGTLGEFFEVGWILNLPLFK